MKEPEPGELVGGPTDYLVRCATCKETLPVGGNTRTQAATRLMIVGWLVLAERGHKWYCPGCIVFLDSLPGSRASDT